MITQGQSSSAWWHVLVLIAVFAAPILPSVGEAAEPPPVPSIPLPYHNQSSLVCSDCHSMHASQQHSYAGGSSTSPPGGPPETYPWSTTPVAKLLRRVSSAQLCLACHDGQSGVPDVMDADTNGLGDDRAAGFFAALDTTSYKGHNLKTSPGDLCTRCHFGGGFSTAGLTCIDCHNPHGNRGYRNLQWASSPNNPSQPKMIAFSNVTGIDKYNQNNIGYSAPAPGDATWREVTNICTDCHHNLSGAANTGGTSPFTKHPGTDSERSAYHPINGSGAHTDPANWVAGSGGGGVGFVVPRVPFIVVGATTYTAATTVAANNEVFCLSCHKAHGSPNAFSLRWSYGTGSGGTSPAGCQQCHNK